MDIKKGKFNIFLDIIQGILKENMAITQTLTATNALTKSSLHRRRPFGRDYAELSIYLNGSNHIQGTSQQGQS